MSGPFAGPPRHHPALFRLSRGASPDSLGAGKVAGRWDLRALKELRVESHGSADARAGLTFKRARLKDIDFSASDLRGVRFESCVIENCIFDGVSARGLAVFGRTRVDSTSFAGSDLRDATMGGDPYNPLEPCGVRWTNCIFGESDMRGTVHTAESYVDCDFSLAKLDRVDFEGSRHHRSVFAGRLREITFRRQDRGRTVNRLLVNRMDRVDFSGAQLEWCSFKDLDLATVNVPEAEHIIVSPKVKMAREALKMIGTVDSTGQMVNLRVLLESAVKDGPASALARLVIFKENLGDDPDEQELAISFLKELGWVS